MDPLHSANPSTYLHSKKAASIIIVGWIGFVGLGLLRFLLQSPKSWPTKACHNHSKPKMGNKHLKITSFGFFSTTCKHILHGWARESCGHCNLHSQKKDVVLVGKVMVTPPKEQFLSMTISLLGFASTIQ